MDIRCGKLYPWLSARLVHPWEVYITRWLKRVDDGRELLGCTLPSRRRIYIRLGPAKEMRETLSHELLHGFFTAAVDCAKGDGSIEEYLVRSAEPLFYDFLEAIGFWKAHPIPEELVGMLKDEEEA